jgi:TonB-dependent receptor
VHENGWDLATSYRYGLGVSGRSAVKVGASLKWTDRTADTRSYDVFAIGLNDAERQQPAEAIFNGTYAQEGRLSMTANAALGVYTAADRIAAGFTQLEWDVSERVRIIAGARVEQARLDVATRSVGLPDTTARLNNTDILPAVAAQLRLGTAHNLRVSISQTVSRPEYRELSPAPYFDLLGGQTLRGNPTLRRARVQNFDARWEWYPAPAAVASVALFAKRFINPIERILIQRSDGAPEATFVNATKADNYGLELELRHSLGLLTSALEPVTAFANATLMQSEIRPGNDSLSSLTSKRRPMVGQSSYVVNTGLTYASASGRASVTVLYNTAGRRISEAAIYPLPDVYEEARHLLDASLQLPVGNAATIKLDGKNLLDAPIRFSQGGIERLYYRSGRVYSVGISWTP